jgi:hypothetical protein
MRWCDHHGVGYILSLARNSVLQFMAAPLMQRFDGLTVASNVEPQAEEQFVQSGQKTRLFGELTYAAQTWDRSRRVIVKAERLTLGPNLRFVVTNLTGEPQALYDDLYCRRGEMENRIKEQQLHLFADRTSCSAFVANQFRLILSSAAYVLVEALRRIALAGTELAQAQTQTIRLKLFKIGARIVLSARRIVLHLAAGYPLQSLLTKIVHRLLHPSTPAFGFG